MPMSTHWFLTCQLRDVLPEQFLGQQHDLQKSPGPVFMKGLSQGLGLKLRLLSQVSAQKLLRLLSLVVFTKNLRPVLGLAKGSTLRLVGSGLKFCKEDLNMAAINFSPLQNLKWL